MVSCCKPLYNCKFLPLFIGIATGFVYLITPLETWDSKLSMLLSDTDTDSKILSESEWIK